MANVTVKKSSEVTMLCNSFEMAVSLQGYLSDNGVINIRTEGPTKKQFYVTAEVPVELLGSLHLRHMALEKANQLGNVAGSVVRGVGGVAKSTGAAALGLTMDGLKAGTEVGIGLFGSLCRGITGVALVGTQAAKREKAAFSSNPEWGKLKGELNVADGSSTFVVK